MRRQCYPHAIVAAVATFSFFGAFIVQTTKAQEGSPQWVDEAESALVGTWTDTAAESDRLPDLDVRINRDVLKISAVDSDAEDEIYEQLYVLAGPSNKNGGQESDTIRGFASMDADFGEMHLMLSLDGKDLNVEAVQIYKDGSGRTNRIVSTTYVQSVDQRKSVSDKVSDGKSASSRKPAASSRTKSNSTTKMSKAKRSPKVATIAGKIETRSTLRGEIRISPVAKNMQPAEGIIKVSGTNPSFDFSNLPEGKYTIHFDGTINGASRVVDWNGVKADSADKSPVSLSLRTNDDN